MSTVKRPREPEEEEDGGEEKSLSEGPPLSKRRRQQSAAEEAQSAKEAVVAATASAASSSSSAAAPSFAPVMGYCCVNPLLGQCVQREIKDLKQLQSTGSKLGCAKTKAECEKSCILPQGLLRNVASNLGYPEPDLPRLYQSMLSNEAKMVYRKNIAQTVEEATVLEKLIEKSRAPGGSDNKNEISGYKELILQLNRDLGKSGSPEIGLWIASIMLSRMIFEYRDPEDPDTSMFAVAVLNTLFRRGYVDRYSPVFQRLLWSNILQALEEYVTDGNPRSPTGLLMMVQLAGQEPKSGPIWNRESLSAYLLTLGWRSPPPEVIEDAAIAYFSDVAVSHSLLGQIQARLPLYMIEALYRWILDKTIWSIARIGTEQGAERQAWKLPALDNLSDVAYVGNMRDPWWQKSLQQRFENAWSVRHEERLKAWIARLAQRPLRPDSLEVEEFREREDILESIKQKKEPTTFAEKYDWLHLLMKGRNMVPEDFMDDTFKYNKFALALLARLFYMKVLEHTIELANQQISNAASSSSAAAAAAVPALLNRMWPRPFTYPTPGSQFAVGARMLTAPIPPISASAPAASASATVSLSFFPVAPATFTSFQSIVAPSTAFAASPAAFASSSSSSSSASALPKKNAGRMASMHDPPVLRWVVPRMLLPSRSVYCRPFNHRHVFVFDRRR